MTEREPRTTPPRPDANPWSDTTGAAWPQLAIWYTKLAEYPHDRNLSGLIEATEAALWNVTE